MCPIYSHNVFLIRRPQIPILSNNPSPGHFCDTYKEHHQRKVSLEVKVAMHYKTLLTISISAFIFALATNTLPAPTTPSSKYLSVLRLQSATHCNSFRCPDGEESSHLFCQSLGCDFCVVVVSKSLSTHYECDGLGRTRLNGSSRLVDGGNGTTRGNVELVV